MNIPLNIDITAELSKTQLEDILKAHIETLMPQYKVVRISFDLNSSYNDPRDYSPASLNGVKIKLARREGKYD